MLWEGGELLGDILRQVEGRLVSCWGKSDEEIFLVILLLIMIRLVQYLYGTHFLANVYQVLYL